MAATMAHNIAISDNWPYPLEKYHISYSYNDFAPGSFYSSQYTDVFDY